ncbi:hypothetical protein AHEVV2_003 [Adoxophyes honmai entomopoxvirus 'L' virophage 2]|nr:hypothetical protein AHEVV2_003 [Adoxophyes honmai entomopoxvirus 'L' virophage 2]
MDNKILLKDIKILDDINIIDLIDDPHNLDYNDIINLIDEVLDALETKIIDKNVRPYKMRYRQEYVDYVNFINEINILNNLNNYRNDDKKYKKLKYVNNNIDRYKYINNYLYHKFIFKSMEILYLCKTNISDDLLNFK